MVELRGAELDSLLSMTAADEEILPVPPRSRSKVPPHPSGSAP
jgi:hypothetical protein